MERHSLLLQLDQSKSEQDRLSGACQEALEMESQVEKLRKDVAGMVSHETFMAVCGDLEVALKREQELKVSLTQHGVAVKQLQERLQLEGKNLQANNDAMFVVDKVNEYTVLSGQSLVHVHYSVFNSISFPIAILFPKSWCTYSRHTGVKFEDSGMLYM